MSAKPTLDPQGVPLGYPFRPEHEISARDAAAKIQSGEAILLDCRTEAEWEIARVEGATHIPLHELESRLDEVEPDGRQILTLCHHGRRSLTAAMILQNRGHPDARSIVGGIELWSLDVDPSVPRYVKDAEGCRLAE